MARPSLSLQSSSAPLLYGAPALAAVNRADLVTEWVAQIRQIDLAKATIAPPWRILDALAPARDTCVVKGLDLFGAVARKADSPTVGVRRRLPIDGSGDPKYAKLGAIENPSLRIGFALWDANGAKHGIVKLLGRGYIGGPDHNVRKHG